MASGLRRWTALFVLFCIIALALYANGLNNPFHYDDQHHIVNNHHLRDSGKIPDYFHLQRGKYYFSGTEQKALHYRPLLLASYALNYQIGGYNPVGYHLYNLLLHVAGALLVVALAAKAGLTFPWAVGAGLAFLVLPFHTEAINYISARSSLQSGVFTLAALVCFIHARTGKGGVRLAALAGAFFLTLLALLTKEVAVVIPLLFLLYDLVYPPPKEARWGVHGYGLHGVLMGAALVFLIWQGHASYFLHVLAGGGDTRSVADNLWLQAQVLTRFVQLTLLPVGLSIVHEFPGAEGPNLTSAGCGLLLAGATAGAVMMRRTAPLLLLGWGLFLIVLLPTTLLPMNTPLQESRGYAAAAGIILTAFSLLRLLAARFGTGRQQALAGGLILILLCVGTVGRNPVWSSDMRLWSDAVAKAPTNFRAHANLGSAFHAKGELETAVMHYKVAIDLYPDEASSYANLGGALTDLGDMQGAGEALHTAIKLSEPDALAHYNLGHYLEKTGDLQRARSAYERAIKLNPSYAKAYGKLGVMHAREGDVEAGATALEKALELAPDDPRSYVNLMVIYRMLNAPERGDALWQMAQNRGMVTPELEKMHPRPTGTSP